MRMRCGSRRTLGHLGKYLHLACGVAGTAGFCKLGAELVKRLVASEKRLRHGGEQSRLVVGGHLLFHDETVMDGLRLPGHGLMIALHDGSVDLVKLAASIARISWISSARSLGGNCAPTLLPVVCFVPAMATATIASIKLT
ncbi:MAG: hypothetical protein R3E72_09360 [Steroidobacteraceae bacterium]